MIVLSLPPPTPTTLTPHQRASLVRRWVLWLLCVPSSTTTVFAFSSTSSFVDPRKNPVHVWTIPSTATVLSHDPLIYTLPDVLSADECQAYIDYVSQLSDGHYEATTPTTNNPTTNTVARRTLTRSNPPYVSLDRSKLWPLPFLSLAAGIPSMTEPFITLSGDPTVPATPTPTVLELLQLAQGPIFAACLMSVLLVWMIPPILQAISNQSARTSVAVALNQRQDFDLIRPLVQRLCTVTGRSWTCWEAPVVTRYDPGARFTKHGDASPTLGSEWENEGGQRVVTCICYLNDVGATAAATAPPGGGETYFDQLNIAVTPQRGQVLVFFPAHYTTKQADDRTTHESLPPMDQEKWIVQLFGRIGPRVPPPLGIPDDFAAVTTTTTTTTPI